GMIFRSIGPAGMSGRVTSIDVVDSNKDIIYAGTSAGGLWMSDNGGINFKTIFNNQKATSIGDLAIYQKNPSILYLGTGEGNPRNSQSYGYGMYKSLDGGKTWMQLGLEGTKNIHRVLVHPDNPDVVWAGAIGSAWGPSEDRGVFKSTDGGKTWNKILYANTTTGVGDMVMDPRNPNKILVAMWDYERKPWTMRSGGEGSTLHMTMDGGDTWTKLDAKNGLPAGTLGRIGLAIAPNNPNVIYANVEAEKENAMYRSDNGGQSWRMTTNKGVGDRPFYYNDVEVDPTNENRVYHVATTISRSEDGGKSFRPIMNFLGGVHSDHHAFWINPDNPSHILDGNDGGLYGSSDMGKTWKFHHNIPVGQFYHVNVDDEIPYNVYGGMQDNGSWCGPAYKFEMFGKIQNGDYVSVGFGDGFDVIPHPENSKVGYSMFQGGEFQYYDRSSGIVRSIKPQIEGKKLRFNWNAAMAIDPHNPSIVYGGSQYVLKSMDNGRNWEIISPDLTTNNPEKQKQHESGGLTIDNTAAENHTTIVVIEPSTLEEGLLWVGTDDGNLQITRDGGQTWTDLTKNLRGVPSHAWITQIKHSTYNHGEAFVVIDNHRMDDWTPYILHTKDYGKSWTRLVDDNDVWGYTLSFVQDPVEPNLMFVGTEFGLYVSFDGGEKWNKWKADFPTVSAMDMVIHPREHDLVVGTFGRSLWVLDDIRPLRALAGDIGIMEKDFHLCEIPHAYQPVLGFPKFFAGAGDAFSGQNRADGALISFYAREAVPKDSVLVEFINAEGEVVREVKTIAKPGLNRMSWDLKTEGGKMPGPPDPFAMFALGGNPVLPGTYTVRMTIGGVSQEQSLDVHADPDMPISMQEMKVNLERRSDFLDKTKQLTDMFNKVDGIMKNIAKIKPLVADHEELKMELDSLEKQATMIKFSIVPKPSKGIVGDTPDLKTQLMSIGMYYFSPMVEPDGNSVILMKKIDGMMIEMDGKVTAFEEEQVKPFKEKVNAANLTLWK
ncbi:MAG: hypothetical protein HKN68_07645, partial [Saprospiraceae bacterium]|nr:hypothetical protein [Saprospiraceae bacterium]